MSNTYIAAIEYVVGWFIYFAWFITSPKGFTEIKNKIDNDSNLNTFPESIVYTALFFSCFLLCALWPYYIIRKLFTMIYSLLTGKRKNDMATK